jgi:hypothetical protein
MLQQLPLARSEPPLQTAKSDCINTLLVGEVIATPVQNQRPEGRLSDLGLTNRPSFASIKTCKRVYPNPWVG